MADYSEKQIIPFVNKAIKLYLQFYLVLATYPFVVWVGIKFFFFFSYSCKIQQIRTI